MITVLIIVFSSIVISYIIFAVLYSLNKYLPEWFCKHEGWHLEPNYKLYNNSYGKCPRCWETVIKDIDGNWVSIKR